MITEEFRAYVGQMRLSGQSNEDIAAALRSNGWGEADIIAALSELDGVPFPAPIIPTPQPAMAEVSDDRVDVMSETTNAQSEAHHTVLGPLPGLSPESAVFSARQDAPRGDRRKLLLTFVVVLVGTVLLGGGAFAYYQYFTGPTADEVYAGIPEKMRSLSSAYDEGALTVSGKLEPLGELADMGMEHSTFELNIKHYGFTTLNTKSLDEHKFDGGITLIGFYKMGALQFNFDLVMEVKMSDKKLYMKIDKFPEIPFVSEYTNALKGKWIELPYREMEEGIDGAVLSDAFGGGMLPSTFSGKASIESAEAKEVVSELEATVKQYPLFDVVNSESASDRSPKQYHYSLRINKQNLKNFIEKIFEIVDTHAPEDVYEMASVSKKEVKEVAGVVVTVFSGMTAEMWAGRDDGYMRNLVVDLPYSTTTKYGSLDAKAHLDFSLSKFNEPFTVALPTENVTTLDEWKEQLESKIDGPLGNARMKSRDATRMMDIATLKVGLEIYCDDNYSQSKADCYPLTLDGLLDKSYVPSIPTDPLDETPYVYFGLHKDQKSVCIKAPCAGYFLGVSLEDPNQHVLTSDADQFQNGTMWSGADKAGCALEKGRYCYDVRQ